MLLQPTITMILGTARHGRQSEQVMRVIERHIGKDARFLLDIADVRDYTTSATVPPWEDTPVALRWRAQAKKSDAFIIVSPEYNHGYPGELKQLLDFAYKEYAGKPVLLCGVSDGPFGGARMIEHIMPVLRQLGLLPLVDTLYFPKVDELLKKEMHEIDAEFEPRIEKAINALIAYTEKTAPLRQ